MGQQLDGGGESYGAAVLPATVDGAGCFPTPTQKPLCLPRHLTRPPDAIEFAHPTEQELARVFSFYQVDWVYEPTTFHLDVDECGRPTEQVCPDFYLPDHDVYVELTTMRQSLVTRKNRKIRRLKEAFPTVQIRLLYRKDYDRLMGSVFGVNGHAVAPAPGRPVVSERQLQQRIRAMAVEIAGCRDVDRIQSNRWFRTRRSTSLGERETFRQNSGELQLIGLGTGARRFLLALDAELAGEGVRTRSDLLSLTRPVGGGVDRVRVSNRPTSTIEGRDVVLVADVVSTGLSAYYAIDWLRKQGARSVRICSLFDRADARILDVPLDWSGFNAPPELLVGYGISYQEQYDDLPTVSPLRAPARQRTKPESLEFDPAER